MRYVKDTVLEVGHRLFQLRPPQPSLTIVVKGTFEPGEGDDASVRLADEQAPPTGEVHYDEDPERSLRTSSDFALVKPRGECLVVGKAYPNPGRAERMLECRFKIGSIEKRFIAIGDRSWSGRLMSRASDPESFTEMDLSLERAYGGAAFDPNPYGAGRDAIELDVNPKGELKGQEVRPLPNLERQDALIDAPDSQPAPVIVGPRPQAFPARRKLAGTYGETYVKERWPWLAEDLDWSYFLEGPEDQWIDGFWRGDEKIELDHLHAEHAQLRMRLPSIRPRVFLDSDADAVSEPTEVPMSLDTIVWDAELGQLTLVWRGIAEVATENLEELPHLFVAHETLNEPRSLGELHSRFIELRDADAVEEEVAEGAPPPPLEVSPVPEPVTAEGGNDFDVEPPTMLGEAPDVEAIEAAAAQRELEAKLAAARAAVEIETRPSADVPQKSPTEKIAAMREKGVDVPPGIAKMVDELEAQRESDFEQAPGTVFDSMAGPPLRDRIKGRVQDKESLQGMDLTGADLSHLDLGGQDLTGAILRDARLFETNFEGANLAGVVLAGAEMTGAVLIRANLAGASLAKIRAERSDFTEAMLEDADFEGADLTRVTMRRARAARATFVDANLFEARLNDTDFIEADFERANLARADLSRTRLTDALLENAVADEARFDGAEMLRSRGEGLSAQKAHLKAVNAVGSFWEHARLDESDFSNAQLDDADFSDAVLIRASFEGCRGRNARFERAKALGLKAQKADMIESSFEDAELSFADFRGANLYDAGFWRATTTDAQLVGANLTGTLLDEPSE